MAIVYDAKSGRLVRESENERLLREETFRATQSKYDKMRMMTAAEQKRMRKAQEAAAAAGGSANLRAGITKDDSKKDEDEKPKKTGGASTNVAAQIRAKEQENARARRNVLEALTGLEEQTRGAYGQQLSGLAGIYDPQMAQVGSLREQELADLQRLIEASRGQITGATEEFLRNLMPTTAYENVPLLALQAEENPLLAALQSQGAGTQEVASQAALDTALANQLRALSERSAGQLGATEQAYMDVLRRSAQGAQAAGLSGLSARGAELGTGIRSRYADLENQLRLSRAEAEAEVNRNLQNALLGIAEQRAGAIAEYGAPKPPKRQRSTPKMKMEV